MTTTYPDHWSRPSAPSGVVPAHYSILSKTPKCPPRLFMY